MDLGSLLVKDHVCMALSSRTKWEAIDELAQVIKTAKGVEDFDCLLAAIVKREREQTTGVGSGVALPHARTDAVSQMVLAVGVSRQGIDFQSADGLPVRLVFLMGVPLSRVTEYMHFLSRLTRVFCHPRSRDIALSAEDSESLVAIARNLEGERMQRIT